VSHPIPNIPVVDVDQPFPVLTSDGSRGSSAGTADAGTVTPVVENALRDVLGWRPRSQDTAAFEAALAAAFQLSESEDHTVATYSPRGFAIQADLGAVSGGQASLYSRATAARTQMITLLDALTPLRPDADTENCESFRKLVRDALTTMVSELGTPGGPRVAVVDAFLRQLLGAAPAQVPATQTADTIGGQLGQVRDQFGLTDAFVNNVDQEGIRTAFWTLVDLALDTNRAWVLVRGQFTGRGRGAQQGFLGTELVLISQLLSAVAEQLDDLQAALDSVYISAAEQQTIVLPGSNGLTLDGLLTWVRSVVTEEGPRIARDTGRDGIRTSLMPTVLDVVGQVNGLLAATGRPAFTVPQAVVNMLTPPPVQPMTVQAPVIAVGGRSPMPPGMQSSRVMVAVSGLDSLLWQLAQLTLRITRFSGAFLFDVMTLTSIPHNELLLVVRGLNLAPTLTPVFRSPGVHRRDPALRTQVRPDAARVTHDDDTVSAVFDLTELDPWLDEFGQAGRARPWPRYAGNAVQTRYAHARDVPVRLRDDLTGRLVQNQTRP
jgi:hypothetical protein